MTEAGFWFVLGSASISAAVIGWVCFLEVSYVLERRRRRAASTGLAGLKTARVREIVPQPPTTAASSREQLLLPVTTATLKRKFSLRLTWWPLSKHVNQPHGSNPTAVLPPAA
jgi:hypothetical protein